jgi:YD repeat-containing protein
MAEDIYISTTDADGHEISGTYTAPGNIVRVTLSVNGHVMSEHLHGTSAEDLAKLLLLKLDRKRRGKS